MQSKNEKEMKALCQILIRQARKERVKEQEEVEEIVDKKKEVAYG